MIANDILKPDLCPNQNKIHAIADLVVYIKLWLKTKQLFRLLD